MSIGEIRSTLEKLGFETVAVKVPIEKVRDGRMRDITGILWSASL